MQKKENNLRKHLMRLLAQYGVATTPTKTEKCDRLNTELSIRNLKWIQCLSVNVLLSITQFDVVHAELNSIPQRQCEGERLLFESAPAMSRGRETTNRADLERRFQVLTLVNWYKETRHTIMLKEKTHSRIRQPVCFQRRCPNFHSLLNSIFDWILHS